MRDSLSLSCVPAFENCLGDHNATPSDRQRELMVYRDQLKRTFTRATQAGCEFKIKSQPHDFGSYKEVFITFDDTNEEQTALAFWVENNMPDFWDLLAISELSTLIIDGKEYPFANIDRSDGNVILPMDADDGILV